jgi:protoporphyrinogen oxidase
MPSPEHVRFLIIGAGPTGLGAAYRLKELGHSDFLILEASRGVGGLAGSFTDARGFIWDIGGHVQFSHYKYFDELMDLALGKDGWLNHERESWVWIRGRYIPYPFQNNIRRLPKDELMECLKGLIELYKTPPKVRPANFKEWIHASFGAGLASVFMEPYNFKVWAHPLEQMSYEWIGERVAVVDLERVIKNVLYELDDVSWGPNNTFRFPKCGGTGAIWERVANLVGRTKIALNTPVGTISGVAKIVTTGDGRQIQYEHLLNTMPLDLLAQRVKELPAGLKECARGLKYSSTNIVGIGLEGSKAAELAKKCWMYFPEDDCPFYRVTVFSNYSPNNVPHQKYWSLMAEVSESRYKAVDQKRVIEDCIAGMRATSLIDNGSRIISQFHHRVEHGYPIPSIERNEILCNVMPALEAWDIASRGRFGAWKYEVSNQDHSLMQGVEWVNRILQGVPEMTFPDPNKANARRP